MAPAHEKGAIISFFPFISKFCLEIWKYHSLTGLHHALLLLGSKVRLLSPVDEGLPLCALVGIQLHSYMCAWISAYVWGVLYGHLCTNVVCACAEDSKYMDACVKVCIITLAHWA